MTRLGTYTLGPLLGEGGMGAVYRAHDATLGRDVAIKVLPSGLAADPDRRARFDREARMLASLNHPHIAAIYGVAEGDGLRGLVLELVEGETLSDRLSRGALPVVDVLRITRQLLDALDAAHERGIVHRDLKPANIKLTPEGQVKVLDFGLAKAVGSVEPPLGPETPTALRDQPTREGVIVGTVAYMSPEQARGRPVDKRADIWALGCVIYEMLSGRRAFTGETLSDVFAAILEREPDWSALPGATPAVIGRLVRRCLQKDPKLRLRDVGDAMAELDAPAPSGGPRRAATRAPWVVAGVSAAIAVAAVGLFVWRSSHPPATGEPTFSRVVRVTNGASLEFGPAISPDSKWVAYLSDAGGRMDVWVKVLSGGIAVNLTRQSGLKLPTRIDIGGLAISPDGATIAFDAGATPDTPSNLFDAWTIAAPLGGIPRKLVERGRVVRWSPDGARIAYVRAGAAAGDALYVARADGTDERQVVPRHGGMHLHWPAWSADGRQIYFTYGPTTSNSEPSEIYRVSAAGGPVEPVVRTARRAAFPAPLPDGLGLLYAANPVTADLALWWQPVDAPTSFARPITNAVGEYRDLAVAHDTGDVVATLANLRERIVRIDMRGAPHEAERAITDGTTGDLDPTVSRQGGRLAFSSSREGSRNIWVAAEDGSDPRPLTSGTAFDEWPVFSPDGRRLAFVSDRGGRRGIWVINADGGAARLVVRAQVLAAVSWSPDSRELVYATPVGDAPGLVVVDVDSGLVTPLPTPSPASAPVWSPKGDLIAYVDARQPSAEQPNSSHVAFVTRQGQAAHPGLADSPNLLNGFLAWSPDARHLVAFVDPGATASAVWLLDVTGAEPARKLRDLQSGTRASGATWSPDGGAIFFGEIERTSDVVLFQH